MPAKKHTHSYRRIQGSANKFMCLDPDCTHTTFKHLLNGKAAICPKCGERFIMQSADFQYRTLVCRFCHNSPQAKALRKMRDALRTMEEKQTFTLVGSVLPSEGIQRPLNFLEPTDEPIFPEKEEEYERPERIEL